MTLEDDGALARLEMIPTRMHRFIRLMQAGPKEVRWLATTLARSGESLVTSAAIGGRRLSLRW